METLGHKADQPGLRGHSHDASQDLMKQYVLARNLPAGGKLWVASFNSRAEANKNVAARPTHEGYVLLDQFNDNAVIWDEGPDFPEEED